MTCTKERAPQRLKAGNLVVEELPDELMIYDPNRNKAFCLNQTAAFVWKHADGSKSIDQIAGLMAKQMGKPVTDEMVQFSLNVLAKDGLLEDGAVAPAIPAGVSRRELLQRFGLGAMALPAVTVLLVSPAKAHASSVAPLLTTDTNTGSSHHNGGFWQWLESLF